jgi:hypothetical protein
LVVHSNLAGRTSSGRYDIKISVSSFLEMYIIDLWRR